MLQILDSSSVRSNFKGNAHVKLDSILLESLRAKLQNKKALINHQAVIIIDKLDLIRLYHI